MKKLFTIVCLLVSVAGRGQCYPGGITFDTNDSCIGKVITIDTVHYHNNRWQIGAPHKAKLDSPYSSPNVIITDTLNPYPANDTSVFTLKMPSWLPLISMGGWHSNESRLYFNYRLDIDSDARAYVEMSTDSGLHWINVLYSLPMNYHWNATVPRLDTSTNYWLRFDLNWYAWGPVTDTVLFRFTFISDSSFSGKDGWMIDDVQLWYAWESVPLLQNPTLITLYPNPSHGNIYIHTDKAHKDATIAVHDMQGRQVYSSSAPVNGYLNLQLPNGVYTLKYSDEEEYCVKQVVIQN